VAIRGVSANDFESLQAIERAAGQLSLRLACTMSPMMSPRRFRRFPSIPKGATPGFSSTKRMHRSASRSWTSSMAARTLSSCRFIPGSIVMGMGAGS